ncbi:phosphatases II [Aspergillus terreus]|uniref:Phosphatases II n=1 Tax=Aspergillus terreus TaxID=33178 RepID=A0A5M3YUL4_ASPTE|nr:hypothetical protein ATETN484_0004048500 [Aspergillus terreus]GFF13374.1 phosphatases II [Aspergillus terreus]
MAIAASAKNCARHFESLLQLPASHDLKQDWESVAFRFNIWCENDSVQSPTKASMDWRLRDAPLLQSAVVEALDDLERDLIRALHGFLGFANCVEYAENELNLTEEFRQCAKAAMESLLKSSMASEDLKRRIFDTICLRQEHFAYLRITNLAKEPTNDLNAPPASTLKDNTSSEVAQGFRIGYPQDGDDQYTT